MRDLRIKTLSTYSDWVEKAKYEYNLYTKSYGLYDLTNCLLTLNAIPEWIRKSDHISDDLKKIAEDKNTIMKGGGVPFYLDETKLDNIDNQLKLIRMFCNHTKHSEKKYIPELISCIEFPATFNLKFNKIKVDNKLIEIEPIIKSIIDYWDEIISRHNH